MLAIKDNYPIFRIRFYLFSLKLTSALPTIIFIYFFYIFFSFMNFQKSRAFVTCKMIVISVTNFKHSTYKTQ